MPHIACLSALYISQLSRVLNFTQLYFTINMVIEKQQANKENKNTLKSPTPSNWQSQFAELAYFIRNFLLRLTTNTFMSVYQTTVSYHLYWNRTKNLLTPCKFRLRSTPMTTVVCEVPYGQRLGAARCGTVDVVMTPLRLLSERLLLLAAGKLSLCCH